jgi:uncharacterized protein (TIGR02996 family)
MRAVETLLAALAADPGDDAAWLALADSLEEEGRDREAELTRLREGLRVTADRPRARDPRHRRLRELLAAGVRPVMPRRVVELPGGEEMAVVLIPPGSFWMGSPARERGRYPNEGPRHKVRLTRGFWMGETPVTGRQWQALRDVPTGRGAGLDLPAVSMTWHECMDVCRRLGEAAGDSVRLPTEAEWEYACRATSATPFATGTTEAEADRAGWHRKPGTRAKRHPPGRKEPNAWGLFDMHGNVWEWCLDGKRGYQQEELEDPVWELNDDTVRVLRGGSYNNNYQDGRSACRGWARRDERAAHWGCRLVLAPAGERGA